MSRGYCTMHYARWKKHGDPSIVLRPRARKAVERLPRVVFFPPRPVGSDEEMANHLRGGIDEFRRFMVVADRALQSAEGWS